MFTTDRSKMMKIPTTPQMKTIHVRSVLLGLLMTASVVTAPILGQTTQASSEKISKDIDAVKGGIADGFIVAELGRAGATQAVPALENMFGRSQDRQTKVQLASVLVRLGDKNVAYWNYLIEQATVAVDNDAPDVMYDSQGKITLRQFSPDFVAWANAHNVSPNDAGQEASYEFPGTIMLLGQTGDPRAVPLLRRALQSHNYLIQAFAARGLAQIQDKNSIPLIVEACRRAPAEVAGPIADALVYFDDSQAQGAAEIYMTKDMLSAKRDMIKNHGNKPFGQNP
jgi:HEAT repeats